MLFIGEGNPNAKILIIGKEIGVCNHLSFDDIVNHSLNDVKRNIKSWSSSIGYPLNSIKSHVFVHGRNPTWTNYQKLISHIIGRDLGQNNYDFLDYCFMTEMNDVHIPYSGYGKMLDNISQKKLEALRLESFANRAKLFTMAFFQNFPVVIMACGHYPTKFAFDIESIFNVTWNSETKILSRGNFYNEHHGQNKILIHTRQMSSGISNRLIMEIGNLCHQMIIQHGHS